MNRFAFRAVPFALLASLVTIRTEADPDRHGKLPLLFERNVGQTHERVRFLRRGPRYTVFLASNETVWAFEGFALRMTLVGADPSSCAEALPELPTRVHSIIGREPERWHLDIPTSAAVRFDDVYPGVDVTFHGKRGELEFDFEIAPGADPSMIALRFEGTEDVWLESRGDALEIHVGEHELLFRLPRVEQIVEGECRETDVQIVVTGDDLVAVQVPEHDPAWPLVIDPVLDYATYFGGSTVDAALSVSVNRAGQTYFAGRTVSANFPSGFSAAQKNYGGGGSDAFVVKISEHGNILQYATFLGGNGYDAASDVVVNDLTGEAYVVGRTESTDFPMTSGGLQPTHADVGATSDGFVAKLNSLGNTIVYATYLGGTGYDEATGVALDGPSSEAYVSGRTEATDFPTSQNAAQTAHGDGGMTSDAFVSRLDANGANLVFSTYLGGSALDVASDIGVECGGACFVTGWTESTDFPTTNGAYQTSHGDNGTHDDAFVVKLDAAGTTKIYSTFLGGDGSDRGLGIAVVLGFSVPYEVYVTGRSTSSDFPIESIPNQGVPYQSNPGGGVDAFLSLVNGLGSDLRYSSYLGGSGNDVGTAVHGYVLAAFVTGWTTSANFPNTTDALQGSLKGGRDAFLARLGLYNVNYQADFVTYLGGSALDEGHGITVDRRGDILAAGLTWSNDLPPTIGGVVQSSNAGASDAFVMKVEDVAAGECNCYVSMDCPGWTPGGDVYCEGSCVYRPYATGGPPLTVTGIPNCGKPLDQLCHYPSSFFRLDLDIIAGHKFVFPFWLRAFEAAGRAGGGPPDSELVAEAELAANRLDLPTESRHAMRRVGMQVQNLYLGKADRGGLYVPAVRGAGGALIDGDNGLVAPLDECHLAVAKAIREAMVAELDDPGKGIFQRLMRRIADVCPEYRTPDRCEFPHPAEHGHPFPFEDDIDCLISELGNALNSLLPPTDATEFARGDCNDDSEVDISDAISTLGVLFLGQGEITCQDACDSNDDGTVDISDAINTLGVLFLGNGVIPLPGMNGCGADPTVDELTCESFAACRAGG